MTLNSLFCLLSLSTIFFANLLPYLNKNRSVDSLKMSLSAKFFSCLPKIASTQSEFLFKKKNLKKLYFSHVFFFIVKQLNKNIKHFLLQLIFHTKTRLIKFFRSVLNQFLVLSIGIWS